MKELKFRAWDIEDKLYRNVDTLRFPVGGIYFEDGCDKMGWAEVADEFKNKHTVTVILEQFTGLHDKNGKEIYEGDIVNHPGWQVQETVIFYCGSWAGETPGGRHHELWAEREQFDFEVIGTIHDQKEGEA